MDIRSSLKKKSIIALGLYLCFFIAIIGSVTYWVVEPPVRDKLVRNLDLRSELLSAQINEPLNSSLGVLFSIVGIVQTDQTQEKLDEVFRSIFLLSDNIVVSGGIWPQPYSIDRNIPYSSLFYNRSNTGEIDQIVSWNNPEAAGYHKESWYTEVAGRPEKTISWSDVYIDSYTHIQMITASTPYYLKGQFAGVATVDLSLAGLIDFVKKHAEQYDLGVVLRDNYGKILTEHNFKVVDNIYISRYTFGAFDWQIEVVNSKRLVSDEVFEQVMNIELGIVPLLLICVMAGYYLLSRYLINPITVIARKVDESKQGGIIEIAYSSRDEIRHLVDAFNEKTVYLEEEKIKAQASTEAKSLFLATLSHEIRTPMNGVLGTAQILLKTELTEAQEKYLRTLYDSGEHMMTLLNEILDFSKIEQGHLELDRSGFPIDSIVGSINSVYYTLCTEKGLQFKVYSEIPTGRWYYSDKARLRQILFNLLNNAVKFTSRGFVEVYLKEYEEDGSEFLSIRVKDTGIGISKEAQKRIFNPFEQAESSTTRRFGGTGLGLTIVKRIAELMGGGVSVVSEEEIGTSFEVKVKIAACKPGSKQSLLQQKLDYSGLRVLIVEDNRTNTIIIETFMKNKGFECVCVGNGEEALQIVAEQKFDLILMDNHMPVMDGVESISGIRSLSPPMSTVLIFGCTADVFRETRERMLGVGADYIIAKPIDERELDDALYRYARKLYQYQTESTAVKNVEELLVQFFIELENLHISQASATLDQLKHLCSRPISPALAILLQNIESSLQLNAVPKQSDLDQLTLLLINN